MYRALTTAVKRQTVCGVLKTTDETEQLCGWASDVEDGQVQGKVLQPTRNPSSLSLLDSESFHLWAENH